MLYHSRHSKKFFNSSSMAGWGSCSHVHRSKWTAISITFYISKLWHPWIRFHQRGFVELDYVCGCLVQWLRSDAFSLEVSGSIHYHARIVLPVVLRVNDCCPSLRHMWRKALLLWHSPFNITTTLERFDERLLGLVVTFSSEYSSDVGSCPSVICFVYMITYYVFQLKLNDSRRVYSFPNIFFVWFEWILMSC